MEEPTQPTTKTCKQCSTDFTPRYSMMLHRVDTKFCCDDHRTQWNATHRKPRLGNIQVDRPATSSQPASIEPPMPKAITPVIPAGLSDSAQFMVQWLAKDRDRYETLFNSERELRKKLRDEKDKLEKEFEKYKYEQQLEKISNSKPSGLQGISENPLVLKLAEHAGPALGKILERLADPTPQLAGPENNAALGFAQWLATKQPETQQYIMKMLSALAQLPDEATLMQRISQIESIVLSDYMRAVS